MNNRINATSNPNNLKLLKENQTLLKRIQNCSSTYNFRKLDTEQARRNKKRKTKQEYLQRVFKASPGFSKKTNSRRQLKSDSFSVQQMLPFQTENSNKNIDSTGSTKMFMLN
mmetsp:Transcript_9497/g.8363  ORF Transcript_9497/g.8363 Transcript_9497/m.8363 type:complete len:112 (-) Transcript_9497:601-936(-)